MKRQIKSTAILLMVIAASGLIDCAAPVVRNSDANDIKPGRHTQSITGIAFTRDSDRFFVSSKDGTLSLWNIRGEFIKALTGYFDNQRLIDVSATGSMVLASGLRASLWNVEKGLVIRLPSVNDARFIGENELLVWQGSELALYRSNNGRLIRKMPVKDSDIVILGNAGAFAVGGGSGGLLLYDRLGAAPRALPRGKIKEGVFSSDDSIFAALHTNEKREAGGYWKSGVKAWSNKNVPVADFWHADVNLGGFSMDRKGERFFLTTLNGIDSFDRKGKIVVSNRIDEPEEKDRVYGPDYRISADGDRLAVYQDDTFFVFAGKAATARISLAKEHFPEFELSPDGRFLVLGSSRGTLQLWTAEGARVMRTADISQPIPSDFMKTPGEFSANVNDFTMNGGTKGVWVNRDTFRMLGIGRPKEGAPDRLKKQYAREAAYSDGMKKMLDSFVSIRFDQLPKQSIPGDYSSMGVAYRKEFRTFEKSGIIVSERYDDFGVCHAIIELKYPRLRDKVEDKIPR